MHGPTPSNGSPTAALQRPYAHNLDTLGASTVLGEGVAHKAIYEYHDQQSNLFVKESFFFHCEDGPLNFARLLDAIRRLSH